MWGLLAGPCGGGSVNIVDWTSWIRRVRFDHLALTLRQMLVGSILGVSLVVVVKERVEIRRRWVRMAPRARGHLEEVVFAYDLIGVDELAARGRQLARFLPLALIYLSVCEVYVSASTGRTA